MESDKMKERKMAAQGHDIKDMGRKEEHLQRHKTKWSQEGIEKEGLKGTFR